MGWRSASSDAICAPFLDIDKVQGVVILMMGTHLPAETVAAAGDTRFAERELDVGQGPSWDAVRDRSLVVADLLSVGATWPLLADVALGLPPAKIAAAPISFAGMTVGVVEVTVPSDHVIPPADHLRIADLAGSTALLLMALALHDSGLESSQNQHSRRVVHQATGMILRAFHISANDALTLLRAHAFTLGVPVADVADDIVNRRSDFLTFSPRSRSAPE